VAGHVRPNASKPPPLKRNDEAKDREALGFFAFINLAPASANNLGETTMTTLTHAGNGRQQVDPAFYSASPIKRFRRTKAAVTTIRESIREVLSQDHPQTVRQVFYALTVRGVIKKVEIEYQQTVIRLLVDMREAGEIPFGWLADNTRWQRKPATFVGLDACLRNTANFYRRDLWAAMPVYCEVWCEKDALAGVLMEETEL
jgi:hypothetical protein